MAETATEPRPTPARRAWLPLALWLLAAGLALVGEWLVASQRPLNAGRALLLGALLVGAWALLAVERRTSPAPAEPDPPLDGSRWRAPRTRAASGLVGVALVAAGATLALVLAQPRNGLAIWPWLASLVLLATGVGLGARHRWRLARADLTPRALVPWLALVGILILAAGLRLYDLETFPREVHGDEAAIGLEARRLLSGEAPTIFAVGWYDVPMISFAIPAAVMAVAGDDLFGLRLASVLQGLASILLLYLLGRRLFGARVGLLAAALLAVAAWHIHFSRGGFHYMQAVLATVLVVYCLVRGLATRRALDFVLCGYAIGLCLNVYYAARLAPLLAGFYLLHRAVGERGFLRRHAPGLLALALGTAVFLGPMVAAFVRSPQAFLSRTEGVWIFAPANLRHELGAYHVERVDQVLAIQARRTLEAFNISGESSLQYGHPAPLLDFWTGALLLVGLGGVTLLARQSRYALIAGWIWLTLLVGAILTIDAPFSPRIVGVMPPLMLAAALGLESGWRATGLALGGRAASTFGFLAVGLLVLALRTNVRDYFEIHNLAHRPSGFFTVLSTYIGDVNDRYRVYLLSRGESSLTYDTPRFLLPRLDGVDVRNQPLALPLPRIPATKGVAFLVEPGGDEAAARLAAVRAAYPGGQALAITDTRGSTLFTSYLVEHDALLRAAPGAAQDPPTPPLTRRPPPFPYRAVPAGSATVGTQPQPAAPAPRAPEGPVPTLGPPRALPAGVGARADLRLGGFREPRALTVQPDGTLYVVDRAAAVVWRFDSNGAPRGVVGRPGDGPGGLKEPRAAAVDQQGRVIVLDSPRSTLVRFQPDGTILDSLPLAGGFGPTGLAVGPDGSLFVADTGKNRIARLGPDGSLLSFGSDGPAEARLEQPTDVALGPDGRVYVADPYHQRIAIYGPDLAYLGAWPAPRSETLDSVRLAPLRDQLIISDPEHRQVLRYDARGQEIGRLGGGELLRPAGVAIDAQGRIYVADVEAGYVFRYADW